MLSDVLTTTITNAASAVHLWWTHCWCNGVCGIAVTFIIIINMTDSSAAILSQKKNTFFFVFFWQLSFLSFFFFFWLVEFVIIFIGPFLGGHCVTGTSATLPIYLLYRSSSISQCVCVFAPLFSLLASLSSSGTRNLRARRFRCGIPKWTKLRMVDWYDIGRNRREWLRVREFETTPTLRRSGLSDMKWCDSPSGRGWIESRNSTSNHQDTPAHSLSFFFLLFFLFSLFLSLRFATFKSAAATPPSKKKKKNYKINLKKIFFFFF